MVCLTPWRGFVMCYGERRLGNALVKILARTSLSRSMKEGRRLQIEAAMLAALMAIAAAASLSAWLRA